MLGLHILVAIGLAAFAKTLTPLGVLAAFVLVHVALRLSADLLGLRRYVRRLELGVSFAAWFVLEVIKASLDVARIVLAPRVDPQPAVVALQLREPDERVATLLGCLLTLTPGTLALDYAANSGTMYIHAIDARDADDVRDGVREIETRLLAWLHAGDPAAARAGGDEA
ncbi:MAG: multicomponent Na+:H+ antiporter subunit [Thauera sp.]|jgi:multicomponent Na+:H+ antiporter subunit E|nr:Na+/H+ antiporter subunit E [Thauera sp.]MDI3489731.1 multicomponent Na+:H+ antiporter subunit [Thauera sp.]